MRIGSLTGPGGQPRPGMHVQRLVFREKQWAHMGIPGTGTPVMTEVLSDRFPSPEPMCFGVSSRSGKEKLPSWPGLCVTGAEGESCSVMSDSLRPPGLYSPWNSPGQNTGVGSLSLLLGLLPTQGSNPGLPHWRRILYQLSHQGSPRILKWVACPCSGGFS